MFKQVLQLDVKGRDERVYKFSCESKSPMGEIYDALNVMRNEVLKLMQEHQKAENKDDKEQPEAEEKPAEQEEEKSE